ncbi:MAG: hypothetical protein KatS3mg119_1794 [Rhodothalassiaceae bacterium]|nr:MAG: hypothetical protein KatS3mg119_1794 [Rhodothalassiaceae bacterium]
MMRRRRERREIAPHLAPDPRRARRRRLADEMRASRGFLARLLPPGRRSLRLWVGLAAVLALLFAYRYYVRYAGGGSSEGALVLLGMLLAFLGLIAMALVVGIIIARLAARRRARFTDALIADLEKEAGRERREDRGGE